MSGVDRAVIRERATALHNAGFDDGLPTQALSALAVVSAADITAALDALERAEADRDRNAETARDLRRRINGALALINSASPSDAGRRAVLLADLRLTLESSRDTAEVAA